MISIDDRVTLSRDVVFQELKGEAVLLDLAKATYFGLDEVGTVIWKQLEVAPTLRAACAFVVSTFDVTASEVERDVLLFAERLKEAGLVTIESPLTSQ